MQTVVAHRFVGPLDNKTYAVHERYFVPDVIPSRETRVTGNVADPYQHVRVKCAACRTSYLADVAAMRAILSSADGPRGRREGSSSADGPRGRREGSSSADGPRGRREGSSSEAPATNPPA